MALAASVPMPKVYLIDDTAPNAFATGRDPEHASVAITTGLLQKLDREELQGVMAHELSHVRNFDIRFSLMVGVLVGSIALLADFFLRFTFWGGGRGAGATRTGGGGGSRSSSSSIAIVLAILAPIVARLVQLAVSRQREYLADASGVELTRNPYGLERALAKITLDTEPLEVANRATQHLHFDNPIKAATGGSRGLFSTHRRPSTGSTGCASCGPAARPGSRHVLERTAFAAWPDRAAAVLSAGPPGCRPFGLRAILRRATDPRGGPGPGRDSSVGRARD